MRRHLIHLALVALAVLTVGASSTLAARGSGTIGYVFNGLQVIHAINTSPEEMDILAAAGASVSISPASEMRIGFGLPKMTGRFPPTILRCSSPISRPQSLPCGGRSMCSRVSGTG